MTEFVSERTITFHITTRSACANCTASGAVRKPQPGQSLTLNRHEDGYVQEGEAQQREDLGNLELEYPNMGRKLLFHIAKQTLNQGSLVIDPRSIRILLGTDTERIFDRNATAILFHRNRWAIPFSGDGRHDAVTIKSFVTENVSPAIRQLLEQRLDQPDVAGIRRTGARRNHEPALPRTAH